MTIRIHALALISTLALAGAAQAQECSRPPEPAVPNGADASREQMVAAQQEVKGFVGEIDEYLSCLEGEEQAAISAAEAEGTPLTADQRNTFIERYNAAVTAKQTVADAFNAELRVYLDKNASE